MTKNIFSKFWKHRNKLFSIFQNIFIRFFFIKDNTTILCFIRVTENMKINNPWLLGKCRLTDYQSIKEFIWRRYRDLTLEPKKSHFFSRKSFRFFRSVSSVFFLSLKLKRFRFFPEKGRKNTGNRPEKSENIFRKKSGIF